MATETKFSPFISDTDVIRSTPMNVLADVLSSSLSTVYWRNDIPAGRTSQRPIWRSFSTGRPLSDNVPVEPTPLVVGIRLLEVGRREELPPRRVVHHQFRLELSHCEIRRDVVRTTPLSVVVEEELPSTAAALLAVGICAAAIYIFPLPLVL